MNQHPSVDQLLLDKLTEAIESNLQNEQFGVPELADAAGLSKSQLNRRLQAMNGQSASQFIREYRLKRAMELLQSKAATPTEVAYQVGFGSPSYFSTCFKEFYGYSPNEVKLRTATNKTERHRFTTKAFLMTLTIAIVLLLTYSLTSYLSVTKLTQQKVSVKSIVILPFDDLNDKTDKRHFASSVTGSIRTHLQKIKEVTVVAGPAIAKYKADANRFADISRDLEVSYILDGSVQTYENNVRISVYLIDALSNRQIWVHEFNEEYDQLLDLETEIALQITDQLEIKLSEETQQKVADAGTINLQAHQLFWEAKDRFVRDFRDTTSLNIIKRAIAIDPQYGLAYTQFAWMLFIKGFVKGDPNSPFEVQPILDEAMKLEPNNSDNFLIQSALDLYWFNHLENAQKNVEMAIKLSNWPETPINYCMCVAMSTFIAAGKLEDALDVAKVSKNIDHGNILLWPEEGMTNLLLGNNQDAIIWFDLPIGFRNTSYFNFYSGFGYYHMGAYDTALSRLEFAYQDSLYSSMHENIIAYLSNTHYKMGNKQKSDHFKDILLQRQSKGVYHTSLPLAMIAAARKNEEDTLLHLHEAYDNRDKAFAYFVHIDPVFDWLENNQGFQELISRQGFEDKVPTDYTLSQNN